MTIEHGSSPAGWGVTPWSNTTGISRSFTYELIAAGKIQSVKVGARRIITTQPADFLAPLAEPSNHPEAPGRYYRSNEPEAA